MATEREGGLEVIARHIQFLHQETEPEEEPEPCASPLR
jgi:hypothetical protein